MTPQAAPTHSLISALLQLLGWVGFLGLGYMARHRVAIGLAMLFGWWIALTVGFALVWTVGADEPGLPFLVALVLYACVWLVRRR